MRRLAVVMIALALAGCTPSGQQPSPTPSPSASGQSSPGAGGPATPPESPASASPTMSLPPLGERYSLPATATPASWGEPLGSLVGKAPSASNKRSREGWRVDLMGVYRLDGERALVEIRLNADQARGQHGLGVWTAPGSSQNFHANDPANGGYAALFDEFSDVKLTVDGDDNTYLPVRTTTNHCLCTMSNDLYRGLGDLPVYVVMTIPEGAQAVTLTLDDVGAFTDIPLAPAPPQRTVTPLTGGYQLRLVDATLASAGTVRVRFAVERALAQDGVRDRSIHKLEGFSPWKVKIGNYYVFRNLLSLSDTGVEGGWPRVDQDWNCLSCTELKNVYDVGSAIDGEIDLPDPGTGGLFIAPTAGWMLSAAGITGTRARATTGLVEYQTRFSSPGAVVSGGEVVELDTSVLFATNSDKLTAKANQVLDKAADVLRDQDGRTVAVVGHTDSTGTASYNLDLSKRRARSVRDALASRLGSGWTFTTQGRGESDPKIKETGLSGADLKQARALNRRVEVTVK